MHREDPAGYGSLHPYTDCGDNIGKGQLPAGTGNNLQGLSDEVRNRRREEDLGLAHEPIRSKKEG
jgi:hypothetical protein